MCIRDSANAASAALDLEHLFVRKVGLGGKVFCTPPEFFLPVLMPTDSFGVAGGFGYYNDRIAGSASVAARVSDNAYLTGGIGIGFDEGKVGARAGFQSSW